MSRLSLVSIAIAALLVVSITPQSARAQGAPPRSVVTPPPAPIAAVTAPIPSDSAVALCMDGSWVKIPRTADDCTTRGGLRIAMPPRAIAPPAPIAASAANRNVITTQRATLNVGVPAGATMQCKDGTFLFGTPADSRCAQNGGVAAIMPTPAPPPPAPRRP
jgi:hypothetical protein